MMSYLAFLHYQPIAAGSYLSAEDAQAFAFAIAPPDVSL